MALVILGSLGACDHQQTLVDPGDGSATSERSPLLPPDTMLREGTVLRVPLRGAEPEPLSVTVVLLDSLRDVVWRSAPVSTDSGAAHVGIESLPEGLVGRRFSLTAFADRGTRRVYAGSDTAGATSLGAASTRDVVVLGGRSVALGMPLRALAGDPGSGRAFYSLVGSGVIGVLDLVAARIHAPLLTDPGEVRDLDVAGGQLAYLGDAGSRVTVVSTDAPVAARHAILGPLTVKATRTFQRGADEPARVDTVLDIVRPYATRLRLVCEGEAVCRPVAVLSSPTQGGGAVVRIARMGEESPSLVVPGHTPIAGGPDSIPAAVEVAGARRPSGDSEVLLARTAAAGCITVQLGVGGFDVSRSGRLFSGAREACGPGGRIAAIDGTLGPAPALSRLGIATMVAEDRVRIPVEVAASADGSRVLVREADAVWLLDRDLRVLGFREVSDRARIAWLKADAPVAMQFVVADEGALTVHEADSFRQIESVRSGPLAGAPPAFLMVGDRRTIVVVTADRPEGVVVFTLGGA